MHSWNECISSLLQVSAFAIINTYQPGNEVKQNVLVIWYEHIFLSIISKVTLQSAVSIPATLLKKQAVLLKLNAVIRETPNKEAISINVLIYH